jgi:hypothetical protein
VLRGHHLHATYLVAFCILIGQEWLGLSLFLSANQQTVANSLCSAMTFAEAEDLPNL